MSWLFPAAFIPLAVVLILIACFRHVLIVDTAPISPQKRHKWFCAALLVAAIFTLLLVSEIFIPGEPGEFFSNFTHIFSRIGLLPIVLGLIFVGLLQRRGASTMASDAVCHHHQFNPRTFGINVAHLLDSNPTVCSRFRRTYFAISA